ncbi:MAG: lysylphosphatidylglycerol synthase transmembrane domain-containing protein [Planctomycetota bacterium]
MADNVKRPQKWKILRAALGVTVLAGVLGFTIHRFGSDWSRLAAQGLQLRYGLLVAALGLVVANNLVNAGGWYAILRWMGRRVSLRQAFSVYSMSQLSRNVPGGVWNFLGMAWLGKRSGIDAKDTLSAAMIVMLCGLVSGLIVFAVSPVYTVGVGWAGGWISLLVILVVPLGLVLLHPRLFFSLLNAGLRLIKKQPVLIHLRYRHLLGVLCAQCVVWLVSGLVFRYVFLSFLGTAPDFFTMAGIYALAWCVGFLFLPVPNGLGVREAMLAFLLSTQNIEPPVAVAASLVVRLLQLVAEVSLAGVGAILWRGLRRAGALTEDSAFQVRSKFSAPECRD